MTFGVLIGNRGFFPTHLCETGRRDILAALERAGHAAVILPDDPETHGSIETNSEARRSAVLFRGRRDDIDGIIVTLPNFGEERPLANAIRWADLRVPVLVQATPDDLGRMDLKHRRDAFCGKMSLCNNLRNYGIPFSLTATHTVRPDTPEFDEDIARFAATCRVVRNLRNARIGAVGARPGAFSTVRYSERLLEHSGISVETLDLSELIGWANSLSDDDPTAVRKRDELQAYTDTSDVPPESLARMARLGAALDRWMEDNGLVASAIQCWTALQEVYGVVPCALMSRMSNALMPSACETDVVGTVGMYALASASERPAALLDWNNNYGEDPNKAVVFHCSNLPADFFTEHRMGFQEILAGTVGRENAYGSLNGRIRSGPFTYCRVSTDDLNGRIVSYLGEGRFTDDRLLTFGGYGVIEIPRFQELLRYICRNGYEHHVTATMAPVAASVADALETYLAWSVHLHAA